MLDSWGIVSTLFGHWERVLRECNKGDPYDNYVTEINEITLKKRKHPDGQDDMATITQWPAVLWQIHKTEQDIYRTEWTYVDNTFKKTFQKIPFVLGPKCFPGPLHLPGSSSSPFLISFFLSCAWFHFHRNCCLYCCPHTWNISRQSVLLEQDLDYKGTENHIYGPGFSCLWAVSWSEYGALVKMDKTHQVLPRYL